MFHRSGDLRSGADPFPPDHDDDDGGTMGTLPVAIGFGQGSEAAGRSAWPWSAGCCCRSFSHSILLRSSTSISTGSVTSSRASASQGVTSPAAPRPERPISFVQSRNGARDDVGMGDQITVLLPSVFANTFGPGRQRGNFRNVKFYCAARRWGGIARLAQLHWRAAQHSQT